MFATATRHARSVKADIRRPANRGRRVSHQLVLTDRTTSGRWWSMCSCEWASGFHDDEQPAVAQWTRHAAPR